MIDWKRTFGFFAFLLLKGTTFAQDGTEAQTGAEIVAQIRSLKPEGNSQVSGILKVRSSRVQENIPVVCRIVTNASSWEAVYETSATTNRGMEKLVVVHPYSPDAPIKLFYARAPSFDAALPVPKPVSGEDAMMPLAGSDFWLSELGYNFLDWPEQQKLKGEMRLGQPCYVLESRNPRAGKIVRVKSWIEKESGGLLVAEAFDRANKLVKEFSLGGSSFKKIDGRWQLKKMTIRSPREKSETVLEFDLPKD